MGIRNFYDILWKRRIPQILFYISLTIELIIVVIDKSNYINPVEGLLFRITFLLFALADNRIPACVPADRPDRIHQFPPG